MFHEYIFVLTVKGLFVDMLSSKVFSSTYSQDVQKVMWYLTSVTEYFLLACLKSMADIGLFPFKHI